MFFIAISAQKSVEHFIKPNSDLDKKPLLEGLGGNNIDSIYNEIRWLQPRLRCL